MELQVDFKLWDVLDIAPSTVANESAFDGLVRVSVTRRATTDPGSGLWLRFHSGHTSMMTTDDNFMANENE